jgi:hypothetical protein
MESMPDYGLVGIVGAAALQGAQLDPFHHRVFVDTDEGNEAQGVNLGVKRLSLHNVAGKTVENEYVGFRGELTSGDHALHRLFPNSKRQIVRDKLATLDV